MLGTGSYEKTKIETHKSLNKLAHDKNREHKNNGIREMTHTKSGTHKHTQTYFNISRMMKFRYVLGFHFS